MNTYIKLRGLLLECSLQYKTGINNAKSSLDSIYSGFGIVYDSLHKKYGNTKYDGKYKILSGGCILTMDSSIDSPDGFNNIKFILIKSGKISGVYSEYSNIYKYIRKNSEFIKYSPESCILPGFVNTFTRLTTGFLKHNFENLGEYTSVIDICRDLPNIGKYNFIIARGYIPLKMTDGEITKNLLDTVSVEKYIVIIDSSEESVYTNSTMLTYLFTNFKHFSFIKKDGVYTGQVKYPNIVEYILGIFNIFLEKFPRLLSTTYNQSGFTTISPYLQNFPPELITGYIKNSNLRSEMINLNILQNPDKLIVKFQSNFGNSKIHTGACVFIIDGTIQSNNSNMEYYDKSPVDIEQYYHSSGGYPILQKCEELISRSHNIYFLAHSELSIEFVLGLCAKLINKKGKNYDYTITIIGCTFISLYQLRMVKKLNINIVYNSVEEFGVYGDYYKNYSLGPKKSAFVYPINSSLRLGVNFCINGGNPIDCILSLRDRISGNGCVLGKNQFVSMYELLKSMTIRSAKILGIDSKKGTLTPGKRADITVLDSNPFSSKKFKISSVYISGKLVVS